VDPISDWTSPSGFCALIAPRRQFKPRSRSRRESGLNVPPFEFASWRTLGLLTELLPLDNSPFEPQAGLYCPALHIWAVESNSRFAEVAQ